MKLHSFLAALVLILFAAVPLTYAQTPAPAMSPAPPEQSAATSAQPTPSMQGIDRMADSVTKMSEMCQMMMKKEMAALPYLGAVAVTLGALLFTALLLLVVLQVQWIIYWSRLLKAQKRNDAGSPL